MKYKIIKVLSIIVLFLIVIYGFYLRFSNPDMTEARLFLTYWKQIVLMIVGIIISTVTSIIAEYNIK